MSPMRVMMFGPAAAAAVMTLMTAGQITVAGPASATPLTPHTAMAASTHTASAELVTLPTGERLSVRDVGGRTVTTVLSRPDTGISGAMTAQEFGGHRYVMPAAAAHYAAALDPALFDLSALTAAWTRIPVTMQLTGTTTTVPGVTFTARSGHTATGYLTASSAPVFGRALAQQWLADTRAGRRSSSPLGLTRLTRSDVAPPVRPDYPQVTLVADLIGPDGRPADGYVALVNLDDYNRYWGSVPVIAGQARVSVPRGHYAVLGGYQSLDARTGHTDLYAAIEPDYTISATDQHVVLDERRATATPSVRTPRPATEQDAYAEVAFRDVHGEGANGWYELPEGDHLHLTPAPAPQHGTMHLATNWILAGAPTHGLPYTYDLSFDEAHGIPADLSKVLTTGRLVTLNARYFSDGIHRSGSFGRIPLYPFQGGAYGYDVGLTVPLARTEYLNMSPGVEWGPTLVVRTDSSALFVAGSETDYVEGRTYTEDWLRGPLAPDTREYSGPSYFECPACRASTRLSVALDPILDTTPGHSGGVGLATDTPPTSRFQVWQDGAVVFDQPNATGADLAVPAGAHAYRVVEHTDRGVAGYLTSTQATTELTFVSSAGNSGVLPAGWHCDTEGAGRCGVLGLMTARVFLPTDLNGRLPAGTTDVEFTVGHIVGARTVAVTSASLSTSRDGVHFVHAPVTALGHGRYRAHLTTPRLPAGTGISLRVSGTDAAGGAITKTVRNAYLVGG